MVSDHSYAPQEKHLTSPAGSAGSAGSAPRSHDRTRLGGWVTGEVRSCRVRVFAKSKTWSLQIPCVLAGAPHTRTHPHEYQIRASARPVDLGATPSTTAEAKHPGEAEVQEEEHVHCPSLGAAIHWLCQCLDQAFPDVFT